MAHKKLCDFCPFSRRPEPAHIGVGNDARSGAFDRLELAMDQVARRLRYTVRLE